MVIRRLNILSTMLGSTKLFHTSPRLKPPRFDLRKRKVLDDPDLEEDVDLKEDLEDNSEDELKED